MKKALIISDKKAGHYNQSVALCRHLGVDYEILEVGYPTGAGKALSYLFDKLGVYTESLYKMAPTHILESSFDLIVSTGSTTYYPNKLLAKRGHIPNIAILSPKGYRLNFTHIFCPTYDHPPEQDNITTIPLNLCAADPSFFEEKTVVFKEKYTQKKPAIGIIIGGPNHVSVIDEEQLGNQLKQIFEQTKGFEHWVTTSRRTPPEITHLIETFEFDYKVIAARESYNPIPAFIDQCKHLFVTSDSASMISECASFGSANVDVLVNKQKKSPNKFEELIDGLVKNNAIHVFDGTCGNAHQKLDLGPLIRDALATVLK